MFEGKIIWRAMKQAAELLSLVPFEPLELCVGASLKLKPQHLLYFFALKIRKQIQPQRQNKVLRYKIYIFICPLRRITTQLRH